MDGKSLDLTAEKLAQLRDLFPEVFSEGKVDFARLKDILGENVVFPNEHYELSWAGKTEARKEVQKQTANTLIADKEGSIDFENAQNLFIEGENLEVLRILQKSYFGKVKMIYIDPPYNTGNDSFVYPDDYAERLDEYKRRAGITDEEGYLNKQDLWRKNTRENGQFHSVWLSMMYPRLYLARNLLREDGMIFVSIDDNEVDNLRLLLDEVFGEENHIGQFIVQSNPRGSQSNKYTAMVHEYVLAYSKRISKVDSLGEELSDEMKAGYSLELEDGRKYRLLGLRQRGGAWRRSERPLLYYPIYINSATGKVSLSKSKDFNIEVLPIKPTTQEDGSWRWNKAKVENDLEYLVGKQVQRDEKTSWDVFQIDLLENSEGEERLTKTKTIWSEKEINYQNGTTEVKSLFNGKEYFSFPKPVFLIEKLIKLSCEEEDIVLDFFSGSGTTAHAILALNEKEGGNRQFICVQMPELLEENSEAYKAGYRTIADISKARITNVIEKLQKARSEQLALESKPQVLGFRSFKIAPSNFKNWRGDAEGEELLKQLDFLKQSEKDGSLHENMLVELLLKSGLALTAKVETLKAGKAEAYLVEDGRLFLFFGGYNKSIKELIHEKAPKRVVCLDSAFKGKDEDISNFKLELKEAGIELSIL